MADNLSSGDTFEELERLQRAKALIELTYDSLQDSTHFSLHKARISKLTRQEIQIANDNGLVALPITEPFKRGRTEILALKMPDNSSAPFAKSCFQMKTDKVIVWLIEVATIIKSKETEQ